MPAANTARNPKAPMTWAIVQDKAISARARKSFGAAVSRVRELSGMASLPTNRPRKKPTARPEGIAHRRSLIAQEPNRDHNEPEASQNRASVTKGKAAPSFSPASPDNA